MHGSGWEIYRPQPWNWTRSCRSLWGKTTSYLYEKEGERWAEDPDRSGEVKRELPGLPCCLYVAPPGLRGAFSSRPKTRVRVLQGSSAGTSGGSNLTISLTRSSSSSGVPKICRSKTSVALSGPNGFEIARRIHLKTFALGWREKPVMIPQNRTPHIPLSNTRPIAGRAARIISRMMGSAHSSRSDGCSTSYIIMGFSGSPDL